LADIFNYLNSVNTNIQGKEENILTSTDKLLALQKKISLWKNYAGEKRLDMFPSMQNENMKKSIFNVLEHLKILEENIVKYFPSLNAEKYDWIRNPFISSNTSEFSINEEEELISLSSDRGLKLKHSEMTLDEFWISLTQEYPLLSEKALVILLQFSTSYLCELGFSTLTNIKTKKRERLGNLEEEMRVALSFIRPDISEICKKYKSNISH